MRKTLLATTALAAAGMVSFGSSAPASAAERLKLELGGYFQAYYAFVNQSRKRSGTPVNIAAPGAPPNFVSTSEPAADRRWNDLKREGEIFFKGEVALDNGMKVGIQVELEAETCGDQIDESYIYFTGDFGKVIIGSENSAAYLMSVGAPAADASFDGADPNYRLFQPGGNRAAASQAYVPNITGDSEKITYMTPRFSGFMAGISFTGDNCEEASVGQICAKGGGFIGMPLKRRGITQNNGIAFQRDIIELAANYTQNFDGFGVRAGATYGWGKIENRSAFDNATSQRQWTAGLNVTFGQFTVGGGYYWDNMGVSRNGDSRAYAAGVAWQNGPLRLGASYLNKKMERGTAFATNRGVRDDRIHRYLVGGSYQYAPGMQARAAIHYYDLKGGNDTRAGTVGANTNTNNDSWAFTIGTVLLF
ncbi:MAG: porin [Alphaproteobacteria bacterium]